METPVFVSFISCNIYITSWLALRALRTGLLSYFSNEIQMLLIQTNTHTHTQLQEQFALPASVEVCLKARTWESDKPVRREMTVSIMYSS